MPELFDLLQCSKMASNSVIGPSRNNSTTSVGSTLNTLSVNGDAGLKPDESFELHRAAFCGDLERIKELLESAKLDPRTPDKHGIVFHNIYSMGVLINMLQCFIVYTACGVLINMVQCFKVYTACGVLINMLQCFIVYTACGVLINMLQCFIVYTACGVLINMVQCFIIYTACGVLINMLQCFIVYTACGVLINMVQCFKACGVSVEPNTTYCCEWPTVNIKLESSFRIF